MKNIILLIAVSVLLSGCFVSVGKKCTYTQEGTRISSLVWFYKDKPVDLDKINCNWYA
jgi:uncharacterized protein YceK